MGSLFAIRHGQASFGQAEYDALSELGRKQSTVLGQMLAQSGLRFDRILQGGMQRHRDTAQLTLQEMSSTLPIETAPWLNEFDHNAIMRGLHPDFTDPDKVRAFMKKQANPAKAFHKEFEKAMELWMSSSVAAAYPESFEQFKDRCSQGLSELLRSSSADANILLFTSGGPIARLMQIALECSDAVFLRLNGAVVNAALTRLPFKNEQLFVSYFNDHAHFGKTASPLLTYR